MKKLTLLILSFLHFWSLFSCQQYINPPADVDLFADVDDLFPDLDPSALNGDLPKGQITLLPDPTEPITLAPIAAIMHLQNNTESAERFKCQFCTRDYKEKKNLSKHIKKEHSRKIDHDQKWPCKECGTKHRTISDLKSHQRTVHQKVFRFRCPHYKTCKYICTHMGDLNKHASRWPRDPNDKHIGKPDWENIESEEGWS